MHDRTAAGGEEVSSLSLAKQGKDTHPTQLKTAALTVEIAKRQAQTSGRRKERSIVGESLSERALRRALEGAVGGPRRRWKPTVEASVWTSERSDGALSER
jgi:hypothetical protein